MAFILSRGQCGLIDSQGHMNEKFYKISKSYLWNYLPKVDQ